MAEKGKALKKIVADAKRIRKEAGTKEKTKTEYSMKWNTAVKKASEKYRREQRTDAPIGNEQSSKPKKK